MSAKKEIYDKLWMDRIHKEGILEDVVSKGKNDPSYSFDVVGNVANYLMAQFNINEKEHRNLFEKAFREACSGSGNELGKISTLHSSSLCALLHFYLLAEKNNNHTIELEIDKTNYTFKEAVFEFQNRVTKAPSNIDVVLLGKNESGKKAVLFLESKFSEYIVSSNKSLEIKTTNFQKYGKVFEQLSYYKNGKLEADAKCYIDGIMQTVLHYIGIRNRLEDVEKSRLSENNRDDRKERDPREECVLNYIDEDTVFFLGEILFKYKIDGVKDAKGESYYEDYKKRYAKIAKDLNGIIERDINEDIEENIKHYYHRFRVIEDVFDYKEKWVEANPRIKEFYYS